MNRRHLLPRLVLVAVLLVPALASAQARHGGGSPMGPAVDNLNGAFLVGLDIPTQSGIDVGPRFIGELMYGLADITPQLRAELGGRASFAYHSADFNSSLWTVDLVPDMRLIFGATPRLALYGDFGVGLAIVRASSNFGGSNTDVVAAFQLAPGISYALSPKFNFLAEIRFNFLTGGDGTFIALPMVGLQFR